MNNPETMNTRISYLYRDANNEKTSTSCVLPGQMSDTMLDCVLASLDENKYFIPEAIGLPGCRPEKLTDADHPYCELAKGDFEPCVDAPTLNMSCQELVVRFAVMCGKWDEYAALHPVSEPSEPRSIDKQITDMAVSLLRPLTGKYAESVWLVIQDDDIADVHEFGTSFTDAVGKAIAKNFGIKV